MKKYELTDETVSHGGTTLHRIRAVKGFGSVKAGYLGGWVEGYHNLSQEGLCWVSDEARVFGDARISEAARVFGSSWVYGSARVFGGAWVFDNSQVYEKSEVFGNAQVSGFAKVSERSKVFGNARTSDL